MSLLLNFDCLVSWKMILKFLFTAFFLICSVYCVEVVADDIASKKKELSGIQVKIKTMSQSVEALKKQQNVLVSVLKKLDIQYGKSALQLSQLASDVEQLQHKLEKSKSQILIKLREIDSQKQALGIQVKAAYAMGRNEKLKLLLSQQDSILSSRVMGYYDYLNKERLQKITRIDHDLQALSQLKSVQSQQQQLLQLKLDKTKQQNETLSSTKIERERLLVEIKKQFYLKKHKLIQYKANEKRLQSLILSLKTAADKFPLNEGSVKRFSELKGKLPWPVKGSLENRFGDRRVDNRWDGVLIKARSGDDIRVVARGRVVFSDWLRGYGLLIIIDHGKGYMTLYAFNQSLYKSVGDWVDAGTVIATVGQSGGRSTAGLYFGVRRKGKPVNPAKWCRKIHHGNVG